MQTFVDGEHAFFITTSKCFILTLRTSNKTAEYVKVNSYVLKQGSPDIRSVVITTCKIMMNTINYQDDCTCPCPKLMLRESIDHKLRHVRTFRFSFHGFSNTVYCKTLLQDQTKQESLWNDVLLYQHTLRIELSCLVFFVSYPSSKHRRVVLPDPANSDRFKSAKPSCTQH